VWLDDTRAAEAELRGLTVVDPESVITTHITEVIKEHMPDLLTYGVTQELIKNLPKEYQTLLSEIPGKTPAALLQHVLQALLAERVSIRNLPRIVEAVAEATASTQNVKAVVEHVRSRMAQQICRSLTDELGYISVITLSPDWERELNHSVSKQNGEESFVMSPQRVQEFVLEARQKIQSFSASNEWPALLVSPTIRPYVRSVLERVSPTTAIISHNEVHRKSVLRTVATIGG
jgi:flagellar biosynthesis protein FlhA